MPRIAVTGATGKMGGAILRLAGADERFEVRGVIDRSTNAFISDGAVKATSLQAVLAKTELDVCIDFTRPEATMNYLEELRGKSTAVVIGTTGFTTSEREKIAYYSRELPILLASNMSLGLNLLIAFSAKLAKALDDDFNVDIFEAHHRHKVDSPSGSAKSIGEAIARAKDATLADCDMSTTGPRPLDGKIRFQSMRSGGITGHHKVTFGADEELIELSHTALNRDVFARGALKAALWLHRNRKPGLYNMFDVLGVKTDE